jgi:hypothetical protein
MEMNRRPKIAHFRVRKCRSVNNRSLWLKSLRIFPIKEVISKEFTNRIKYLVQDADRLDALEQSNCENVQYADLRIERSMTPKLPQTRR